MEQQTATSLNANYAETSTIPPALTLALRAAIRSNRVNDVFVSAGATKFKGTPEEVLGELAAAHTAAWIVGAQAGPMAAPTPNVTHSLVLETASETIDFAALRGAAELVGVRGSSDIQKIAAYLAADLASTAVEATRFASAEGRPVCHNCVAIGGSNVAVASLFSGPRAAPELSPIQQ